MIMQFIYAIFGMKLEGVINSCVKASCYFLDTGTKILCGYTARNTLESHQH